MFGTERKRNVILMLDLPPWKLVPFRRHTYWKARSLSRPGSELADLRRICKRLTHILFLQIQMLGDDLRRRHAVGDEVDDMSHGYAQAAQRRAPGEDVRIVCDAVKHVYRAYRSMKNSTASLASHSDMAPRGRAGAAQHHLERHPPCL